MEGFERGPEGADRREGEREAGGVEDDGVVGEVEAERVGEEEGVDAVGGIVGEAEEACALRDAGCVSEMTEDAKEGVFERAAGFGEWCCQRVWSRGRCVRGQTTWTNCA